jgi:rubrerythrin
MAGDDRLQALEVALTNEMREREFYLKNAERTSNPVGKAMFLQIADEELEHYERLKELHDKWQKKEKWPETVPLKVKNTDIKNILVNVLKKVDKETTSDTDDLQAIRKAIDFEFQAEGFYKKLREQVTDPREKEFFSLLCQIEREHALSLQDVEEFLTDPEAYYRNKEHHGLDGM